jgi:P27 family predicted phage terminase small subunit
LSIEAVKEWNRVGEFLRLTDRVAKLDHQALTLYAVSYSIYADAMRRLLIDRWPLWGEVRGKPIPSTYVGLTVKHGMNVVRMARKFGMTARTRHLDHKTGCGRPATPQQINELRRGVKRKMAPAKIETVEWSPESVACPDWFTKDAENEWNRLVEQLSACDLWTPLDVGPIAVAAASYALAVKCAQRLEDAEIVLPIRDSEGSVEHPLSLIYEKQFSLCENLWQDYGMSPFDRQQFHHVEGEKQGKPKLAVFPGEIA